MPALTQEAAGSSLVAPAMLIVPNENAVWPRKNRFFWNMRPWFPTFAGVLERACKSVGV